MEIRDVQLALKARGYSPGRIDNVWGRLSIAALKHFQTAKGLPPKGVIDAETIAMLNAVEPLQGLVRTVGPLVLVTPDKPAWLIEAGRRMGLHETRDRSALMAWLRSDRRALGDPSKLPWCGDFVETCLALTLPDEPMVANPYLARNWMRFGTAIEEPVPGAILVFWRTHRTRSSNGHVGFATGRHTADHIEVRGGNQDNRVSDAWLDKSRLLGLRWPASAPKPVGRPQLLAARAGAVSTNEA